MARRITLLLVVAIVGLLSPVWADTPSGSVLGIFAHPDDVFAGPLLAHYAKQGLRVQLVVVANTAKLATPSEGASPKEPVKPAYRERLEKACQAYGIPEPRIIEMDQVWGTLDWMDVRERWVVLYESIRTVILESRPDTVVTFGPEGMNRSAENVVTWAVVTEACQSFEAAANDGYEPRSLYYIACPKSQWAKASPTAREQLVGINDDYAAGSVDVPDGRDAGREALSSYKAAFSSEQTEAWQAMIETGQTYFVPALRKPPVGGSPEDTVFPAIAPDASGKQSKPSLLAVCTHPDDDVSVAPLLAHYAKSGASVHVLTLISGGDGGGPAIGLERGEKAGQLRYQELKDACRAYGISEPIHPAIYKCISALERGPDKDKMMELIRQTIREIRPDCVITIGPDGGRNRHPEHKIVSMLTSDVCLSWDSKETDGYRPGRLYYVVLTTKDRLSALKQMNKDVPISLINDEYITTVVDGEDGVEAAQAGVSKYISQKRPEAIAAICKFLAQDPKTYLRRIIP